MKIEDLRDKFLQSLDVAIGDYEELFSRYQAVVFQRDQAYREIKELTQGLTELQQQLETLKG